MEMTNEQLLSLYNSSKSLEERKDLSDTLIRVNEKMALKVAYKYRNQKIEFDDAVQLARIGIFRAIDLYDESKGYKFSTLAFRLACQEVIAYLIKNSRKKTPLIAIQRCEKERQKKLERLEDDIDLFEDVYVSQIKNELHDYGNKYYKGKKLYVFQTMIEDCEETLKETAAKLGCSASYINLVRVRIRKDIANRFSRKLLV